MAQRLLQILHASDPHVVSTTTAASALAGSAAQARWTILNWPFVGKRVAAYAARGTLGDDPWAWPAFERSATAVLDDDPDWRSLTWLCITGDLSTWGDDDSLAIAVSRVDGLARGLGIKPLVLYGNHDVWSGEPPLLPLQVPEAVLARHHASLRGGVLSGVPAFAVGLGSPAPSIEVVALNSAVHEPLFNTFAMGWVGVERDRTGADFDQVRTLRSPSASAARVRVVLLHHPIHDPALTTAFENGLQNGRAVAQALAAAPIPSVVLSGHTHVPFPPFAKLPDDVASAGHTPLQGSAQLTAGTVSQRSSDHTWQLLRFWEEDDGGIAVERIMFERTAGQGEFEPLCGRDPLQYVETMRLS